MIKLLILKKQNHVRIYEIREKSVENKCATLLTPNAQCNNIIIHSESIQSSAKDDHIESNLLEMLFEPFPTCLG
uniref:Putative ovule protein n=1 Tax=Solanum chacoense TaxID=4108 RepID=A0A0V0HYN2_SOLCH